MRAIDSIAKVMFDKCITVSAWGVAILGIVVSALVGLAKIVMTYIGDTYGSTRRFYIFLLVFVVAIAFVVFGTNFMIYEKRELSPYIIAVDEETIIPMLRIHKNGEPYAVYECNHDSVVHVKSIVPPALYGLESASTISAAYMWEINGIKSEIKIAAIDNGEAVISVPFLKTGDSAKLWLNVLSACTISTNSDMHKSYKPSRRYASSGWKGYTLKYIE